MKRLIVHLMLCASICFSPLAAALDVNSFSAGSMQQIRSTAAGDIQIVSLWSVDCNSCYKEMGLWQQLSAEYPQLQLVMIATDAPQYRAEVEQVLTEKQLTHLRHWQFDHTTSQRLRYEIDPTWYGELPRTYLYDRDGRRIGISGLLNEEVLRTWLAQSLPTK